VSIGISQDRQLAGFFFFLRIMPMSPAPKGNTNALKHGFYSRRFKQQEIYDLDMLSGTDLPNLTSELDLLRVALLRTFEQAQAGGEDTDWTDYLSDIGLAATRVASLLRTQKILDGSNKTDVANTILAAIAEVNREMNISF
jgi:hypothetical protein